MANSFQTQTSGQAELKDYYEGYDSTYEALKRRRKKAADKEMISSQLNDQAEFDKVPRPDAK